MRRCPPARASPAIGATSRAPPLAAARSPGPSPCGHVAGEPHVPRTVGLGGELSIIGPVQVARDRPRPSGGAGIRRRSTKPRSTRMRRAVHVERRDHAVARAHLLLADQHAQRVSPIVPADPHRQVAVGFGIGLWGSATGSAPIRASMSARTPLSRPGAAPARRQGRSGCRTGQTEDQRNRNVPSGTLRWIEKEKRARAPRALCSCVSEADMQPPRPRRAQPPQM